jgi:hypothetical protein
MTDDRDARTTAIGLYHYARSYHEAARALYNAKVQSTHPDAPVSYLYFHCIELFLKAYLRLHGHTVKQLESAFGHKIKRMKERASERGFDFMEEDLQVLAYMEKTDVVINSRYITTGAFERPSNEALDRTAASLRETVSSAIEQVAGIKVLP